MNVRLGSAALVAALVVAVGVAAAPGRGSPPAPARDSVPSLVILVVVDQLRGDLLERYDPFFTGGLRRLRDEGLSFTRASHAHAYTETAAGHATLATGTRPARHGIVANDWTEPAGERWRNMYSVEDGDARVVGAAPSAAGRSPANLMRPTLGDWAREARPDARVVAISKKDRSAITTGGLSTGAHVYWIDTDAGGFVTSDHYRDRLPGWVSGYNREAMPAIWADTVWEAEASAAAAGLARPDTSPGSERAPGIFPHRAMAEGVGARNEAALRVWVSRTPAMDRAVLGLASEAIGVLDLGGRAGGADVLAVGLSAADYVGHDFGPLSREQLENLLLLDRELGRFLDLLDREVGEGRWALALSADHGVATVPEWETAEPTARRIGTGELRAAIAGAVGAGGSEAEIARRVADAAEAFPFVAQTYLRSDLARGVHADSFAPLYANALMEGRLPSSTSRFGVEIRYQAGIVAGYSGGGSTHGTPYWYDRHVPLVLLGPGVARGLCDDPVFTWDVAPTLAAWAGIPAPDDLDGRDLRPPTGG